MDKKTEKYLLIGGAVLVGGYFLWTYYQNQQAAQAAATASAPASPATPATTALP